MGGAQLIDLERTHYVWILSETLLLICGIWCSQDLMFTMKSVMGGQRGRGQERSMKVSEARAVLEDIEAERLVSEDMVRAARQLLQPYLQIHRPGAAGSRMASRLHGDCLCCCQVAAARVLCKPSARDIASRACSPWLETVLLGSGYDCLPKGSMLTHVLRHSCVLLLHNSGPAAGDQGRHRRSGAGRHRLHR